VKPRVYILHDFNGRPYYKALEEVADVVYLNTRPLRFLARDVVKYKKISLETLDSLKFMFLLPFHRNKTIMLAMAPFNFRIIFYSMLLKKNCVYYHTSWPYWTKGSVPFLYVHRIEQLTKFFWVKFLSKVDKVITVTKSSRHELELFTNIKDVSQIYHTVDISKISNSSLKNKTTNKVINICFIGRLVEEKGIIEIIELARYFENEKHIQFHVVGDGPLKKNIEDYSQENISFYGYNNDRSFITNILAKSDLLLLPSKKTPKWEELFGMVIIEAMSQGCVVISTNHIGPSEIINHNVDGFLLDEACYVDNSVIIINKVINNKKWLDKYISSAIDRSSDFSLSKISKLWRELIEK
jgi:glycosyltransferase involved in cell wall biosynthesis